MISFISEVPDDVERTMFKKLFKKTRVKSASSCGHDRSHPVTNIPFLDLDGADREDDGFVLVGETKSERTSCKSVEENLDLPPSYESLRGLPLYAGLFPDNMGNRNGKQELFEPTLHTASRQTSQEGAGAASSTTQNDVLTPYFEALQKTSPPPAGDGEVRAETSILCATAAPVDAAAGQSSQPPSDNKPPNHPLPMVSTPYEDIPFRLSTGFITNTGPTDLSSVNEGMKQGGQSLQYRYTYNFNLEQSVLRDSG